MYPFLAWRHPDVVDRLSRLIGDGFEIEVVLASAQTIEQGLKRILVREMNTSRRGVRRRHGGLELTRVSSTAERNAAVRCLASLGSIASGWSILFEERSYADLESTVNAVSGVGTWTLLSAKQAGPQPMLGDVACIGLFELRHQLVHGWHLPPKDAISLLAPAGRDLVRILFDPHNGLASKVGYDPFNKMPRFRP